jgi:hypothetical protein
MIPDGYLFLSINDGPVVSVPVRPVGVDANRIIVEVWYGPIEASTADSSVRARVEGILTHLSSLADGQE